MTASILNLFEKNYLRNFKFHNDILLSLSPQATILGLINKANNIHNLVNHVLLVFKYYVYRLNIDILIDNLIEIKKKKNNPY